jgi:endonuclease/exonuclease/phosphatase family metal-dependent hydrolase
MRILSCALLFTFFSIAAIGQELKFMTYNIRFDNPADGVNAWPNRKNKVFELIKKYDPDIIGVQEALKNQLDEIILALPAYSYEGVGRDDGKSKGEYSAVLYKRSKFTIAETATQWLSETPNVAGSKSWDAAITRVMTIVNMKTVAEKKQFYVINTHFDHIGHEARLKSAALIKERVASLNDRPVVVLGDLNCTRSEPPYEHLMKPNKVKLEDAAKGDARGTFCTFKVDSVSCKAIDYILHTRQWTSDGYSVVSDHDGNYYPSDHLPVMVTLSLKKAP